MDVVLSFVVIAALVGLLFFLRSKGSKSNPRPVTTRPASTKPDSTFHAVSIVYAKNACQAASNMEGRRFLSSVAPRLPLAECDALECKCRFSHHKDRRKGDDRRNPYLNQFESGDTGSHQMEQRQSRERRDDPPDTF
jgi:hypothetical protein